MPTADRACRLLLLSGLVLAALIMPSSVFAIDLPPTGAFAFIQTSGPNTEYGVGDFYARSGASSGDDSHTIEVYVQCTWPQDKTITFALFDPEIAELDPVNPIPADDEIRTNTSIPQNTANNNSASITRFVLTTPEGRAVAKTYTPNGGTNGLWVELATLLPSTQGNGCGVYKVSTESSDNNPNTIDNDDNAWVLRVNHDPDCTVTNSACAPISSNASDLLSNTGSSDDIDGTPGTGDEISLGIVRTSFQQYPKAPTNNAALSCQTFYTIVQYNTSSSAPAVQQVAFHNFDLDRRSGGRESVTYFPPAASTYVMSNTALITSTGILTRTVPLTGTVSGDRLWNNPPTPDRAPDDTPLRGGDVYTITPADSGTWGIKVCVEFPNPNGTAGKNQYVLEGPGPLFFNPPPVPRMEISKTDGVESVNKGNQLTYVIGFANTSHTTATPGVATNVQIVDQLPSAVTYQGCSIDAPYTGTCSQSGSQVIFNLNEDVIAGASGSVRVNAVVSQESPGSFENVAELTHEDPFGNSFAPIQANDIDKIPGGITAVSLASFTATVNSGNIALAWQTTAEWDTAGFYIRRSTTGSPSSAERVSPLIRSSGPQGGAYTWADATPVYSASYWLEEVDTSGVVTLYGPVKAAATASVRYVVSLPLLNR